MYDEADRLTVIENTSKSLGSCAGVIINTPVPNSISTYSSAITGISLSVRDVYKRQILISSNSMSARVCMTERAAENPSAPPMFCMLLRKHLSGGKRPSFPAHPPKHWHDRQTYGCFVLPKSSVLP